MFSWFDQKQTTIKKILVRGKGILAADESFETIGKRFAELGIENTAENRRDYRAMIFTTPGIEKAISGVILFDETIRQTTADGRPFTNLLQDKGIVIGIKVDAGLVPFSDSPLEKITQGLDGLETRLEKYYALGARFAKWRAAFTITETTPSLLCIEANARRLASYAVACQKHGIVPIVEPEVLMNGDHTIEQGYEVTRLVLETTFKVLREEGVDLKTILLKPNMVVPGAEHAKATPDVVAKETIGCFEAVVPHEVPGIVFLSGGETETEAASYLNAIEKMAASCPWKLTYSFGRALQNSSLHTWHGQKEKVAEAQSVLITIATRASLAQQGKL